MTVQEYAQMMGSFVNPPDAVMGYPITELLALEVDTPCGRDCVQAIKRAAWFAQSVRGAVGDGKETQSIERIMWDTLCVFYYG